MHHGSGGRVKYVHASGACVKYVHACYMYMRKMVGANFRERIRSKRMLQRRFECSVDINAYFTPVNITQSQSV